MNSFYREFEQDLIDRGLTYGGGRLSPDQKYLYINIPKNANSYLDQLFSQNNWTITNIDLVDFNNTIPVVVLRDPVERWISGITQYLASSIVRTPYPQLWEDKPDCPGDEFVADYNDIIEGLLFDQIIFDDHTMPQYYYFDSVKDHHNIKFFYMDRRLNERISQAFGFEIIGLYDNKSEDDVTKNTIGKFLKNRINTYSVLQDRIRSKYSIDYEIINRHLNATR